MSFDLKFAYSEDGWDPPAPVLQVAIAPAKNDPHLEFSALLDTGADMSVLPGMVIEALGLAPLRYLNIQAFENGRKVTRTVAVYVIHLRTPGGLPDGVLEVVQHEFAPDERYIIIGRDLLNLWRLTLDGPGLRGEISG